MDWQKANTERVNGDAASDASEDVTAVTPNAANIIVPQRVY